MVQVFLIGVSAGAASALLFASVASGSPLSVLLFYLAPLPILIAAMGWSHLAALVAAVVASAGLAAIFSPLYFITFLVGIGLPAWWLGYLALLARTNADGSLEWYPAGHLVFWAALLSAMIVIGAMLSMGIDADTFRTSLRSGLARIMARGETADGAREAVSDRVLDFLVAALPPAAAVLTTLTSIVNLWLAERVARISGRLRRPPSDLSAMRFPAYAPALAAAAVVATFVPGMIGLGAGVVTASLSMAYAVLGFAVLHAITRGMNSRPFTLGGTYLLVLVLGWPVLAMTLLGLADTAFDFRGRLAHKRGGSSPPRT
jgi:hypothetical protein